MLTFIPFLPLVLHNLLKFEALVMDCLWSSFLCLSQSFCLLLNFGNKPITELIILEKVLGLLANITKDLCSIGSGMYNCLMAPPVKLYILPLLETTNGMLLQIITVPG